MAGLLPPLPQGLTTRQLTRPIPGSPAMTGHTRNQHPRVGWTGRVVPPVPAQMAGTGSICRLS